MRRAVALAAAVLFTASALAGCTEVPSSSAPERILPIGPNNAGPTPTIKPTPGQTPRQIVQQFLSLNAATDLHHTAARRFLTATANEQWQDTSVTVVSNDESIGSFDSSKSQIAVRAAPVGTLTPDGVYTPSLQGAGEGGTDTTYAFTVKKVNGQYRIDKLPPGLLLTSSDFEDAFKQFPVYFYDSTAHYLVPDLRLTELEGVPLQNWLVDQLVDGPRRDLLGAVNSDTFPPGATPGAISVTEGQQVRVNIPGAQRLGVDTINRLAAQLAFTLNPTTSFPNTSMAIVDRGAEVTVASAGGPEFVLAQFKSAQPTPPPASVYYLREGHVVDADGRTVRMGSQLRLESIAVARRGIEDALTVAGVTGAPGDGTLQIGTQTTPMVSAGIHGVTSRPSWAPGSDEVWVATGHTITRLVLGGSPDPVNIASLPDGARIVALRLSPEGSRVALVVQTPDRKEQLYVGAIVRAGDQASVNEIVPLSPVGVTIVDVAWSDSTRLLAVGNVAVGSDDCCTFEVNVDGSDWQQHTSRFLPASPNSVTVVANQLAWVSSGGAVWEQLNDDWVNPGIGGPTSGDFPVYLE